MLGTIFGLLSGGAAAYDMITRPGGRKVDKYKDPYVRKMEIENDKAIEANKYLSPEAARQASASSLQSSLSNATAGALNASTAQNVNSGIGGDASLGTATQGARNIANVMGATAPIQQALAQGHQEAYGQQQQKVDEAGKLAAQGAEIGDKYVYDTYNKSPGQGIFEALSAGSSLAGYGSNILSAIFDNDDKNVGIEKSLPKPEELPPIPPMDNDIDKDLNGMIKEPITDNQFYEEYIDPITGQKKIRRKV